MVVPNIPKIPLPKIPPLPPDADPESDPNRFDIFPIYYLVNQNLVNQNLAKSNFSPENIFSTYFFYQGVIEKIFYLLEISKAGAVEL